MNNYVHDNNNPNVPRSAQPLRAPLGTGMSVSGGRNDTVMGNRFVNNNAWGIIFVPYPTAASRAPAGPYGGPFGVPTAACSTGLATPC